MMLVIFLLPIDSRHVAKAAVAPSLTISPAKFDLAVEPTQVQQVKIRITNNSEAPLPIKVAILDFAPRDNTGGLRFDTSVTHHSAVAWFKAEPSDLLLASRESKFATVTISPPDTLSEGSYFAAVMFQANLPANYFDESPSTEAQITPWIGALFTLQYGTIPNLTADSLTITRFDMPQFTTHGTIPATIEVRNNTNFRLAPKADFTLNSMLGPVKARAATEETSILPGASRLFHADLAKVPFIGIYKGKATIEVANYKQTSHPHALILLTWEGGAIIVVTLVVLWLNRYRHRRFVAAMRTLFYGSPHNRR